MYLWLVGGACLFEHLQNLLRQGNTETLDVFAQRYRNRLELERPVTLLRQDITPFVRWEVFYNTQTSVWSKRRYYAGVAPPVTEEVSTELYYMDEDNDDLLSSCQERCRCHLEDAFREMTRAAPQVGSRGRTPHPSCRHINTCRTSSSRPTALRSLRRPPCPLHAPNRLIINAQSPLPRADAEVAPNLPSGQAVACAGGAAGGALMGAIAGNAGLGAAIGGGMGSVGGFLYGEHQQSEHEAYEQRVQEGYRQGQQR